MLPAPRLRLGALAILLLVLLPLAGTLGAAAQEPPADGAPVVPLALDLTFDAITAPGTSHLDGDTLRIRDMLVSFTVSGDLSGTATLATDLDWAGPCDVESATCAGAQEGFADVELVTEEGSWSGSLALEIAPAERPAARGILIGRQGAAGQVLIIDEITAAEGMSLSVAGSRATLAGPVGGINISHSACLTGETTADGGFLGGQGLIVDNGPARIVRHQIGAGQPFGVYGEVKEIGHKGVLRGTFVAELNDRHAHGNFVLAGESGPYRGMIGYGRALLGLSDDPRCESGVLATSTWIGEASYVTDPAGFLAPRVYFRVPVDGARLPTPVDVELVAEHVEIEAAGVARDGAGYLVVIIDAPCIGPGEAVPDDEQHLHLREGETAARLNLFTGKHRLCLQLADGTGIAQPATDVVTITVTSSGGDGNL